MHRRHPQPLDKIISTYVMMRVTSLGWPLQPCLCMSKICSNQVSLHEVPILLFWIFNIFYVLVTENYHYLWVLFFYGKVCHLYIIHNSSHKRINILTTNFNINEVEDCLSYFHKWVCVGVHTHTNNILFRENGKNLKHIIISTSALYVNGEMFL